MRGSLQLPAPATRAPPRCASSINSGDSHSRQVERPKGQREHTEPIVPVARYEPGDQRSAPRAASRKLASDAIRPSSSVMPPTFGAAAHSRSDPGRMGH